MCVLKIDRTIAKLDGVKNIKNISHYHSIQFQRDGAFYKEFYDIGTGNFHGVNGM